LVGFTIHGGTCDVIQLTISIAIRVAKTTYVQNRSGDQLTNLFRSRSSSGWLVDLVSEPARVGMAPNPIARNLPFIHPNEVHKVIRSRLAFKQAKGEAGLMDGSVG
jgi:hypothetical protein